MKRIWIVCAIAVILVLLPTSVFAIEKRKGKITLSNGKTYEGELAIQAKIKLYLKLNKKHEKRILISLDEIARVEITAYYAKLEETYFFPEEGKKIKEKTGKFAPRKKFKMKFYLTSGVVYEGRATFQIYLLQKGKSPKRFDIRQDMHGKEGEKLDSLVHVSQIYFSKVGAVALGVIKGKVRVGEKVEKVIAYGRRHLRTFLGTIDEKTNNYEIKNLPDDIYDLCIICEKSIYVSCGALKPENATDEEEKEITKDDIDAIKEKIQKQIGRSEFFDRIRVLKTQGWRGAAAVLLWKERVKPTHLDTTDKEHSHQPRRLEIWLMHRSGESWVIDKRVFFFREVVIDTAPGHLPVVEDKLAGAKIGKNKRSCQIDLILKEANSGKKNKPK